MRRAVCLAVFLSLAAAGFPSWGDPIKWDQMHGVSGWMAESWFEPDNSSDVISADDWLCTEEGWITEVRIQGSADYGSQYVDKVRVTIWADVPRSELEESHPGELLWDVSVDRWTDPNDPYKVGWSRYTGRTFSITLPRDMWFHQLGSSEDPRIYWIAVQGVMHEDGFINYFFWDLCPKGTGRFAGDLVQASVYYRMDPWWHVAWDEDRPRYYDNLRPPGWEQTDLDFALFGRPVPEPATIGGLGLGLLVWMRSWRLKKGGAN